MSNIWQNCLIKLQTQIAPLEFNTWIKPLQVQNISDTTITLSAPNRFVVDWVIEHHLAQIEKILRYLTTNELFEVEICEQQNEVDHQIKHESKQTNAHKFGVLNKGRLKIASNCAKANINPNYKFDNFVEGKSNQLAKAVAMQVAQNFGANSSNPFFLYGGTGLGKTHLIHAIGNHILQHQKNIQILYIHSEAFVQDMVKALGSGQIEQFKDFYRSIDVLLIDDIQFFADKSTSQEIFFHTFNALFDAGHQIILTSDRYPKEISNIQERLKSRFSWGLSIAIEPPDLETRVAILLKKADEAGIKIPNDVAFFIGQRLRTNVRELEGSLNKLKAYTVFTGKAIDLSTAVEALKDMLAAQEKAITIDNIQKVVAEYFKIKVADLKAKSRSRSVTRPRQIAMTLAKELTNLSLPEIGKNFGDRDHTTVLHACKTINNYRKKDTSIDEDYTNLIRILSA